MENTYFLGGAEGVEVALKTNEPAMGQGPGGRVLRNGFTEEAVRKRVRASISGIKAL